MKKRIHVTIHIFLACVYTCLVYLHMAGDYDARNRVWRVAFTGLIVSLILSGALACLGNWRGKPKGDD